MAQDAKELARLKAVEKFKNKKDEIKQSIDDLSSNLGDLRDLGMALTHLGGESASSARRIDYKTLLGTIDTIDSLAKKIKSERFCQISEAQQLQRELNAREHKSENGYESE